MPLLADTKKIEKLTENVEKIAIWDFDKNQYCETAETYYFDWLTFGSEGFAPFVKALVKLGGDQKFYFYDLDSMPIEKFYGLFKKYPVLELDAEIRDEAYFTALREQPGDVSGFRCTVVPTNKYAIFPESMNWHIYGEYDIELARLVTKVGLPDVPFPYDFISEEEAHRLIALLDKTQPKNYAPNSIVSYVKGNVRYDVRDPAISTGRPSADYWVNDKLVTKMQLLK